jgi:hypothetical protein
MYPGSRFAARSFVIVMFGMRGCFTAKTEAEMPVPAPPIESNRQSQGDPGVQFPQSSATPTATPSAEEKASPTPSPTPEVKLDDVFPDGSSPEHPTKRVDDAAVEAKYLHAMTRALNKSMGSVVRRKYGNGKPAEQAQELIDLGKKLAQDSDITAVEYWQAAKIACEKGASPKKAGQAMESLPWKSVEKSAKDEPTRAESEDFEYYYQRGYEIGSSHKSPAEKAQALSNLVNEIIDEADDELDEDK